MWQKIAFGKGSMRQLFYELDFFYDGKNKQNFAEM